ncbi:MAG TPA: hypothetical protein VLB83_04745, partial [Candidatus Paceibacterota bacterium]|nr:hypothetical protein [Candidatus Paceibacterota bacterium]
MDRLRRAIILPLISMRKEYLPFLLVYFAFGAAAITNVASQFWSIQQLGLTPATLAAYSMWMGLPWAIKMLPGQLVDALPIGGSNRRSYIFLGATLLSGSYALLAGASGGHA